METIESLSAERDAINNKLRLLETQKMVAETVPTMRARIGQCFKYGNSASGDERKWFLYLKIKDVFVTDNYPRAEFQGEQFQAYDYLGMYRKVEFWNGEICESLLQTEIPASEYEAARAAAVAELVKV
jgi:hypothetical protein